MREGAQADQDADRQLKAAGHQGNSRRRLPNLVGRAVLTELVDPATKRSLAREEPTSHARTYSKRSLKATSTDSRRSIWIRRRATPVILDTLGYGAHRLERRGDGRNL